MAMAITSNQTSHSPGRLINALPDVVAGISAGWYPQEIADQRIVMPHSVPLTYITTYRNAGILPPSQSCSDLPKKTLYPPEIAVDRERSQFSPSCPAVPADLVGRNVRPDTVSGRRGVWRPS